jgi:hypothetical protein
MFDKLLGGLVDKEKIAHDTIQETLVSISKELGVEFSKFFVMIKPIDKLCDMKYYIYLLEEGKPPKIVRELTLTEIFGDEEENG